MARELARDEPLDIATGPGWRDGLAVAVGGSVGTLARDLLTTAVGDLHGLPAGVFAVNVSGALLLGVLVEVLVRRGPDRGRRRQLRLLLGTGVLGGYTTYSALAVDAAGLVRSGRAVAGTLYASATVVVGGLASWAGILLARRWGARR